MATRTSPDTATSKGGGQNAKSVLGMARGGGLNLFAAICSQGAMLLITILLARWLGRTDVGRYAQCYAFLSLLGLLSLSGFRAGLTRFIAMHLADDDAAAVRGTVRLGLGCSVGAALILGAVLFGAAPWVAGAFHDSGLTTGLRLVGVTLPAATFTDAALAATQGWRSQVPFAVIGNIFEPTWRLGLSGLLLVLGAGVDGAFVALAVGSWTTTILAGLALRRRLRTLDRARPTYQPRELFAFSTVSWMSSLASTGLIWADTLLLGLLQNSGQVGVYNVATRLVTLAVFVMPPINASFGPYVAHLHHKGDQVGLGQTYAIATSWIIRLSLPAFIALLVYPRDLLHLFGHGFATGALVTVILAAGKLIDASTGPCGIILNMSGRPMINMIDNVSVLVLNVLLNLWLIPSHGIIGAAVAWSVSLLLVNVARVTQVWLILRILPVDAGVLKGLFAGACGLIVALTVDAVLPESAMELGIGMALMLLTYVGLVVALGITNEDRLVLRSLASRRTRTA